MNNLPSFASQDAQKAYNCLKEDLTWILNFSGQFWNWPSLANITAPTLMRLLAIHSHLKKTSYLQGSILEFGAHIFTKLKVIRHVLQLIENEGTQRSLFGFDHLKGYKLGASPLVDVTSNPNADLFKIENSQEVRDSVNLFNTATKVIYGTPNEIFFVEGELPNSYYRVQEAIGAISLCYFDFQDVKVMSRLVPMVLNHCHDGALLVFEGVGLDFFPEVTKYVDSLIQKNKRVKSLDIENRIPFSTVVEVQGLN